MSKAMNFPYSNSHGACSIPLYTYSLLCFFLPCSQCFTTLVVSISSHVYIVVVYTYTHQPLLVISTEKSSNTYESDSVSKRKFVLLSRVCVWCRSLSSLWAFYLVCLHRKSNSIVISSLSALYQQSFERNKLVEMWALFILKKKISFLLLIVFFALISSVTCV